MVNSGIDNLIPVRSESEAREKGRKGGIASGRSKRAKRDFAEALRILIELPEHSGKVTDLSKVKNVEDLKTANLTLGDKMLVKLAIRALNSDQSFLLLRDQIGEHPVDSETMKSSAIENLAEAIREMNAPEAEDHIDEIPS